MNHLKNTYVNLAILFSESICVPDEESVGVILYVSPHSQFHPSLITYLSVTAKGRFKEGSRRHRRPAGGRLSRSVKPRKVMVTTSTRHTFAQETSVYPQEEERGTWVGRKLMSTPETYYLHQASDKDNYSWPNVTS